MTAIDNSVPLAVAIRIEIQQAAAANTGLDRKAIIDRIEKDGKVTAAELKALQQALAAEVAAGTIDEAKAKAIMSGIAGRLGNNGSAEDRATIRDTVSSFDSLSLTNEQLTAAFKAAKNQVDRGLLAKEVRAAGADGKITGEELSALWQKAIGSDGIVSAADVRTIYGALDQLKKNGKIDDKQYAALRSSMDAALLARAGKDEVDVTARDYIKGNNTAHALDGGTPTSALTWTNAIDMLEFSTGDSSDTRKLGSGAVAAFADMVSRAAKPISDFVAKAVAQALDSAVAAGKITKGDAKAIAATLDKRIAHERFGVGAKADFSIVGKSSTVLSPIPDPVAPTTGTPTPPTGTGTPTIRVTPRVDAADVHALLAEDDSVSAVSAS